MPYARPPVGALRWMPPQASAKWTEVRQATAFGPTCAQITTLGPFAGPPLLLFPPVERISGGEAT